MNLMPMLQQLAVGIADEKRLEETAGTMPDPEVDNGRVKVPLAALFACLPSG
jgi:hypothetical protein